MFSKTNATTGRGYARGKPELAAFRTSYLFAVSSGVFCLFSVSRLPFVGRSSVWRVPNRHLLSAGLLGKHGLCKGGVRGGGRHASLRDLHGGHVPG